MIDCSSSTWDVAKWLEGPLERGFLGPWKMRHRRRLSVVTFRCEGCGYLESYAPASPG